MARIRLTQDIQGMGKSGEEVAVTTAAARKFIEAGSAAPVDFTGQVPVSATPEPVPSPVIEPGLEDVIPDTDAQSTKKPKKGVSTVF